MHATSLRRDDLLPPLNIRRRLALPNRDRATFPPATPRYRGKPPVADARFQPAIAPRLLRGARRKLSGEEFSLSRPAWPQSRAAIPAMVPSSRATKSTRRFGV